jgi:hypothetical protein
VPAWLLQELGPDKSFDDVRDLVRRLREYMTSLKERVPANKIVFPDIELLPTFQPWVSALVKSRRKKKGNSSGEGGGDQT